MSYDPKVTGKTEAELRKEGYRTGITTNEIVTPWGHSTGHKIGEDSGKAEPKK